MANFNINATDIALLKNVDTSYLDEILLDNQGRLKVVPYKDIKDIAQEHISTFCVKNGIYAVVTKELVDFLEEEINQKKEKTIEIGSGNGVIGKALDIKGTDSLMQLRPEIKAHYESLKQAIVPYGEDVEKLDAMEALRKYRPEIVIGAWCTHKYNSIEHWRGGNEFGINERKIVDKTKKYIHIGNEKVHSKKPIIKLPHRVVKAPWLVSRSMSYDLNAIYIWE